MYYTYMIVHEYKIYMCMDMCKLYVYDCLYYTCLHRLQFADEEEEVDGRRQSTQPQPFFQDSPELVTMPSRFEMVQQKGTIDVWWIYDDGGLSLLSDSLPCLVHRH